MQWFPDTSALWGVLLDRTRTSDPIKILLIEVIRTWEERTKPFLWQILEEFYDLLAAHQERLRKVTQTEERNLKFLPNCFRMILCFYFLSKFFAVLYNFQISQLPTYYDYMNWCSLITKKLEAQRKEILDFLLNHFDLDL